MASQAKAGLKTANEQEKERMDILHKYVGDMMALEEHISSAVKRQIQTESLVKHPSSAGRIINTLAQISERHEQELKTHLESIGGDPAKSIVDLATEVLGNLAGIYDKFRSDTVAKMVRDDYTALSLAAVGYTMLYTTALSINAQSTAVISLRLLQDYTKVIMEIAEMIPNIVVADLRDNGAMIDESIVQQAVVNTQAAWQSYYSEIAASQSTQNGSAAASKPRPTTKKVATTSSKPKNGVSKSGTNATMSEGATTTTRKLKTSTQKSMASKETAPVAVMQSSTAQEKSSTATNEALATGKG